jgi:hypothetical protein
MPDVIDTHLTHQARRVLLRLVAAYQRGDEDLRFPPDGRSVNALEARGLLTKKTLMPTLAGRQLAAELKSFALACPGVRDMVLQEVREIFGLDDELVGDAQAMSRRGGDGA